MKPEKAGLSPGSLSHCVALDSLYNFSESISKFSNLKKDTIFKKMPTLQDCHEKEIG